MAERVEKPWGYELIWARTDRYAGKVLCIRAGHALSLQFHRRKDEVIHLWQGEMLLEVEEKGKLVARDMRAGESYHIKPGVKHRMTAGIDCLVLEVSTSELEDVVRLEDRYGRA
jgi:mannose-6-phosphate isomerase